MKKQKEKESTYDFSVFDNYECEGQLAMKFNGADIEIEEEKKEIVSAIPIRV